MSRPIPSTIKTAVSSLVARANELETLEPAISYWVRYWIVQKVVDSQKQDRSPEVDAFLVGVLEQLEATKAKYPALVEIENGTAGRNKVENFALNVFDNADKEERAKVASKNTALKFLAAAVFLEACQAFGEPRKDINDKRKYAKVQAMRIQSAIAAGKNPNVKVANEAEVAIEDATVAEQQELDALLSAPVTKVPSEDVLDGTGHENNLSSALQSPPAQEPVKTITNNDNSQDLQEPSEDVPSNPYFPSLADTASSVVAINMPNKAAIDLPPSSAIQPAVPTNSGPVEKHIQSPTIVTEASLHLPDSEAMAAAQKHAKFAISALNYEDVPTAVLELQRALRKLQG